MELNKSYIFILKNFTSFFGFQSSRKPAWASGGNRPLRQEPRRAESERGPHPREVSSGGDHTDGAKPLCPFHPRPAAFQHADECTGRHRQGNVHTGTLGGTWEHPGGGGIYEHLTTRQGLCSEKLVEKRRGRRGKNPLISEEMSQIRFVNQKPIYNMQELICFIFLSYIFVKHI